MKSLASRTVVLAALLAALAGCYADSWPNAPHREIDIVGVVASQKIAVVGANIEYTYTFDDGRTYTLTFGSAGWTAPVGVLLIAGSKPDPWGMVAHPQDPDSGWPKGCYATTDYAIEEHDTTVDLDIGVTLDKAPGFEPNGLPPAHGIRAEMCLDRQGRVMKIYVGGA